jgi:hypothetical protein
MVAHSSRLCSKAKRSMPNLKLRFMLLGTPRSSTSLTARWLDTYRLDPGAGVLGSGINEDGHFEDLGFLELHEEIPRQNRLPRNGAQTSSLLAMQDRCDASFLRDAVGGLGEPESTGIAGKGSRR